MSSEGRDCQCALRPELTHDSQSRVPRAIHRRPRQIRNEPMDHWRTRVLAMCFQAKGVYTFSFSSAHTEPPSWKDPRHLDEEKVKEDHLFATPFVSA